MVEPLGFRMFKVKLVGVKIFHKLYGKNNKSADGSVQSNQQFCCSLHRIVLFLHKPGNQTPQVSGHIQLNLNVLCNFEPLLM